MHEKQAAGSIFSHTVEVIKKNRPVGNNIVDFFGIMLYYMRRNNNGGL